MLMGHPPQLIACGQEHAPHGCCAGLTPGQVSMVVQELVADDAEGQAALADTLAAVQAMAQAGPQACHRVTVYPHAVRGTPSLLACPMVDRPMVLGGRGKVVDVVRISAELCPAFHRGDEDGCERRGAHLLQDVELNWRGGRGGGCLVAALHPAAHGWAARLRGGATAQLQPAWSGGAGVALAFSWQPLAARTLGTRVSLSWGLQVTGRLSMRGLVDATSQQMDTPRRGPLLDISGSGHGCGVQLQWPHADPQPPCAGTPLAVRADCTSPVGAHRHLRAQARRAGPTVAALQTVVAPFTRLDRLAATAWTHGTSGPAHVAQVIGRFLVILSVRYQVFHRGAPRGVEQPHYTDTVWVKR